MFNILDFIDSPDIREYNKDYVFAPSEQAALISMSENKTIYEKINAWQELLDTYTEEEFKSELVKLNSISFIEDAKINFKYVIESNINIYKKIIETKPDNVVYVAYVMYDKTRDINNTNYIKFCSTFDIAYAYLRNYYNEYLDHNTEHPIFAIDRVYIDEESRIDSFEYDENLKLIYINPNYYYLETADLSNIFIDLRSSYIYLPTPFRIGDIVKRHCMFREDEYGIVSTNPPLNRDDRLVKIAGDSSDLILFMDGYNKNEGFYYIDGFSVLECYYVSSKDIPEEYRPIEALSAVRTKKLDLGTFIDNANSHENLMFLVDNYNF